jgi:predicted AAA+ superfamily ATPase
LFNFFDILFTGQQTNGLYKSGNRSFGFRIYRFQKFKLYFADTGLLVSLLDEEAGDDLRANRNLGVYKGALYENAVGEALTKSGYYLYYYKREDSTLEEDFFIRSAELLIPVEVKAKNGN